MRTLSLVSVLLVHLSTTQARPQGILNGLSNLLTSALGGGGAAGEVEDYENAPYTVISQYEVGVGLCAMITLLSNK